MGALLLQDRLVQFYLLLVGTLWIVFFWDYFRHRSATQYKCRTPLNETIQSWASLSLRPRSQVEPAATRITEWPDRKPVPGKVREIRPELQAPLADVRQVVKVRATSSG
jgi:hypothetical protein